MRMKQLSVFVENKPGRLAPLLSSVAQAGINIKALSIADTVDFGIVRMILSDMELGLEKIRGAGFTASITEVVTAEIPNRPGGLLETIVEPLSEAGINIEYIYAFVDNPNEDARVVLKVSDPEKAEKIIGK